MKAIVSHDPSGKIGYIARPTTTITSDCSLVLSFTDTEASSSSRPHLKALVLATHDRRHHPFALGLYPAVSDRAHPEIGRSLSLTQTRVKRFMCLLRSNQCLGWSERRAHRACAVGTAVARRFLELRCVQRVTEERTLTLKNPLGCAKPSLAVLLRCSQLLQYTQ
jgi:hypothetical protein